VIHQEHEEHEDFFFSFVTFVIFMDKRFAINFDANKNFCVDRFDRVRWVRDCARDQDTVEFDHRREFDDAVRCARKSVRARPPGD
jgi:hypothetical protein